MDYTPILFVIFTVILFGYAGGTIIALKEKHHAIFIGLMMLVGLYVVIVITLAIKVYT